MVALNEKASALLKSTAGVNLTGTPGAKIDLFTVPIGKQCVIDKVVVHSPTATVAGGIDFDIGSGANADTWKQSSSLSGLITTSSYIIVTSDNTAFNLENSTNVIGIKPITGSTSGASATIDLFGYLV